MTQREFLNQLENIMELAPGTILGTESLADLPKWDSLAQLGYLAMVDQELGKQVAAIDLTRANTVKDLVGLAGPGIQG